MIRSLLTTLTIFLAWTCTLHADEPPYKVLDPTAKLTEEQITEITRTQQKTLREHNCCVTYAFYDSTYPKADILAEWNKLVAADEKKRFHILLNYGAFSKYSLEIHRKNAPTLNDLEEAEAIFNALKRDLDSELNLNKSIARSHVTIPEKMSFIQGMSSNDKARDDERSQKKKEEKHSFLKDKLKLGIMIGAPILLFLILWYLLRKASNAKPYNFPNPRLAPRLGAEHSATSITQLSKKTTS